MLIITIGIQVSNKPKALEFCQIRTHIHSIYPIYALRYQKLPYQSNIYKTRSIANTNLYIYLERIQKIRFPKIKNLRLAPTAQSLVPCRRHNKLSIGTEFDPPNLVENLV